MINKDKYFEYVRKFPKAFANPVGAGIEVVTDEIGINAIEAAMKKRMSAKGNPESWADVGVAYQDAYITILRDAVRFMPGGAPGTYIRQFSEGKARGVVILPVFNNKVCLLRIFRHSLRDWVYEIPRGFGEEGQDDMQNAIREVQEETGGEVIGITPLGSVHENTGTNNSVAEMFFANMKGIPDSCETEEGIEKVFLLPIHEFLGMISDGTITDGFTIAAAARALLRNLIHND